MTADDIANHIHNQLPEFLDSYLLIARTVDGEPIARYWAPDQETTDEINIILKAVVESGGLPKLEALCP